MNTCEEKIFYISCLSLFMRCWLHQRVMSLILAQGEILCCHFVVID